MQLHILPDRQLMSAAAAAHAAAALRRVISDQGHARVVVATAASQVEFQRALVRAPAIAWSNVEVFQLDEYIGLPDQHPARFRQLLFENLVEPAGIAHYHLIGAETPAALNALLSTTTIDLAFLGIGENAHLAFNDPPADFETTDPYIVVTLDDACRRQQVGEGWFARLDDVPRQAVSMSIAQIRRSREIIVIVPDARKASAVKATLESDISPAVPASILRSHEHVTLFLDEPAASLLEPATRARYRHG